MPETAVRHLTTGHFHDFAEGFVKGGGALGPGAPCPLEIHGLSMSVRLLITRNLLHVGLL